MLGSGLIVFSLLAAAPESVETLLAKIAASGRCADLSEAPDRRVSPPAAIAPGLPPVLSFRYYEGKLHGRFSNTDLMLDDAGH